GRRAWTAIPDRRPPPGRRTGRALRRVPGPRPQESRGSRPDLGTRSRRSSDRRGEGPELDARLLPLAVGLRIGHDAAAGEQAGPGSVDDTGADRDDELAVGLTVEPAERAGVPAAVEMLLLGEEGEGKLARGAAHCRGRVQSLDEVEDPGLFACPAGDRRHEVLDVPKADDA